MKSTQARYKELAPVGQTRAYATLEVHLPALLKPSDDMRHLGSAPSSPT